jgi:hypothetical protein
VITVADEIPDGPDVYRGRIGVILASGLVIFLVVFGSAVLYNSLFNDNADISENATQILSTAIGGMIGVLAGFVGGMEVGTLRERLRNATTANTPTATEPEGPAE